MKILVTGASGKLGQLTLDALRNAGQTDLIATTRNPEKLAGRGIEVRKADFKDPAGLAEAFRGADRLLLISTDEMGARVEHHRNAIRAAKAAGVQHIVYTSLPNPDTSVAAVAPDHAATEKDVRESGLGYTFLRNHLYAEVAMMSIPAALQSGVLYASSGEGKSAYVARQDCANAAAGALLKAPSGALTISGPRAYSQSEIAAIVSEITGKTVVYKDVTPAERKAGLIGAGFPAEFAALFLTFEQAIRNGEVATPTDEVQKLTGKPATDLRDFLRANLS